MKIRIIETGKVFDVEGFVVKEEGVRQQYMLDEVEIVTQNPSELFLQYKKGDILSCAEDANERWVFEFSNTDRDEVYSARCICYNKDSLQPSWVSHRSGVLMDVSEVRELRRATPEEIKRLEDCME